MGGLRARLAHRHGVEVAARIEFTPLADFTSALAAADVVVAPHEKVSQSGVLAVARQLGARTVAAEVGGMPELATRTFPPGDIDGLTRALDAVLGEANGRPAPLDEELAVRAHLRAYGLEVDARPGERRLLMGMPLDGLTREEALDRVRAGLLAGRGGRVLTPNLDILRQYRETPALAEAFDATELLVADGMPLVWASRLEGAPLPQRVTGSDILYGTAAIAAELGRRVFLAGGRPGVAQRAGERLTLANPGFAFTARPCFIDPGPIGAQLDELMDALEADAPDLAYIGLPFAAQVHLMGAMRERLPGTWFVGVGSTFDLVTGDRTRAPEWLQRLGLEWAHRIVHEPHVWRRYLVLGLPLAARLWVHSLGARLRR